MVMNKSLLIPLMIGAVMIIIFIMVASTLTTVSLFILGVIVSYVVYVNTLYKRTPDLGRILPLYLLALGIQFIHFTEEYLTDFTTELPKLFNQEAYPVDYWIVFNMVAYFVFIIGGIILFKQLKDFMIIPLFFILVGVIFNSVAHIMLSIYVRRYFPGLYTALIYMVIGPILMKRILEETSTNWKGVTNDLQG